MSFKCLRLAWAASTKSTAQKVVLVFLADHADLKTQKCWHGIQTIARECQLSKRAVYRAIKELELMGLIKIESGGGKHQTNTYFITLNGDCVAPLPKQTVTNRHSNGDSMARNGDTVAPQQSGIRKESKGERNGTPSRYPNELKDQIKSIENEIQRLTDFGRTEEDKGERLRLIARKKELKNQYHYS